MNTDIKSVPLTEWNQLIEDLLYANQPERAILALRVVLKQLPQHLPSYERLLLAMWMLKRWEEGYEWGTRLLRADPCSPTAWRAVAMATEQRDERSQAHSIWQRAFELDPYGPEIRAGLNRTNLDHTQVLELNQACLAMLHFRSHRWRLAATMYTTLTSVNQHRYDFHINRLISLWQSDAHDEARSVARWLVDRERALLLPWIVLATIGDQNDKALAVSPLETLDPDGEYGSNYLQLPMHRKPVRIINNQLETHMFNNYTIAKPSEKEPPKKEPLKKESIQTEEISSDI